MSEDLDLSGEWTGVYNYPFALPPVPFDAVIHDQSGRISGTTSEIGGTPFSLARRLDAVIDGTRTGASVIFLKMYDQADGEYDVVQYSGTVDSEGDEIGGHWQVRGMTGTFLMVRRPRASEMEALEVEEKIDS